MQLAAYLCIQHTSMKKLQGLLKELGFPQTKTILFMDNLPCIKTFIGDNDGDLDQFIFYYVASTTLAVSGFHFFFEVHRSHSKSRAFEVKIKRFLFTEEISPLETSPL